MEIEGLAETLAEACRTYTQEVVEKVEEGITDIGRDATEEVKSLAPADKGGYRRNWTFRVDRTKGLYKVTVHVKGRKYRLTHLLEYGHLNRDGKTRARMFPHISIAEQHAEEKVNELLENL